MTIWSARFPAKQAFHARSAFGSGVSPARHAAVADRRRCDDLFDAGDRRHHAADAIRPLDRGMGADFRRSAADERERLAGRVRKIPGYPAIPRTQPRHGPRRVQDDLLVGMDAPAGGAQHRRGVSAAVSVFPGARLGSVALARPAVDDFRRRRAAGSGRLVDGVVGPVGRARQRVAIPIGVSFDARLRDLCRHRVDRAAIDAAGAQ